MTLSRIYLIAVGALSVAFGIAYLLAPSALVFESVLTVATALVLRRA